VLVLVELDGLAQGFLAFDLEERKLHRPAVTIALAHCLDDGARLDALVNVQRDGGHLEGGMLGLAGPDQLRVKMGVVLVAPFFWPASGSVSGVTSPTGGLLTRSLSRCS